MTEAIHTRVDRKLAVEKVAAFKAARRRERPLKADDLLEERGHKSQAHYASPDSHWFKLRTNSPLERLMREIRRRKRDVEASPDGKPCQSPDARPSAPYRQDSVGKPKIREEDTVVSGSTRGTIVV